VNSLLKMKFIYSNVHLIMHPLENETLLRRIDIAQCTQRASRSVKLYER